MSAFMLVMVLAMGNPGHTAQHPMAATSIEFGNQKACETALENIRLKINRAYVVVLTCEKKVIP